FHACHPERSGRFAMLVILSDEVAVRPRSRRTPIAATSLGPTIGVLRLARPTSAALAQHDSGWQDYLVFVAACEGVLHSDTSTLTRPPYSRDFTYSTSDG